MYVCVCVCVCAYLYRVQLRGRGLPPSLAWRKWCPLAPDGFAVALVTRERERESTCTEWGRAAVVEREVGHVTLELEIQLHQHRGTSSHVSSGSSLSSACAIYSKSNEAHAECLRWRSSLQFQRYCKEAHLSFVVHTLYISATSCWCFNSIYSKAWEKLSGKY